MTDYIHIDKTTFLRYKNAEFLNGEEKRKLNDKVLGILDKYGCFQEASSLQSYNKIKKPSHFQPSHHYTRPVFKRKAIINPTQTDTDREVTALLNKISKRTFHKICRDMMRVITRNNVETITRDILEKCQKQYGFLDLYIGVLTEIFVKSSCEIREKIKDILTTYIDDFIKNRQFTDFQLDSSDYNEFCDNLDNKKQIIGKHKTILAIIDKIMSGNLIDDYFNIMFNEIVQMDKNILVHTTFERHELLLDIMTDFVKTQERFQFHVGKYYSSHGSILEQYSVKARFKVMDLTCITVSTYQPIV